jgi:hypothetical protein
MPKPSKRETEGNLAALQEAYEKSVHKSVEQRK